MVTQRNLLRLQHQELTLLRFRPQEDAVDLPKLLRFILIQSQYHQSRPMAPLISVREDPSLYKQLAYIRSTCGQPGILLIILSRKKRENINSLLIILMDAAYRIR